MSPPPPNRLSREEGQTPTPPTHKACSNSIWSYNGGQSPVEQKKGNTPHPKHTHRHQVSLLCSLQAHLQHRARPGQNRAHGTQDSPRQDPIHGGRHGVGEIERGEGVVAGGWAGRERLARPLDGRKARAQGFPPNPTWVPDLSPPCKAGRSYCI